MTYEEAKRYILENWFDGDQDVKAVVDGDKETMTMKMAVEAIEKQIPKKPYLDNDNGIYEKEYCPACNRSLFPNDPYCRCGQAIDWSEEK